MATDNTNVVTEPLAMDQGPVAVKIAYKAEARYFRANTPSAANVILIDAAVDGFKTAFPSQASRFDGKSTVRSLRRLGQIFDNVDFSEINGDAVLKAKLVAILGLV